MGPVTDLPMRWGFWGLVWTLAALAVALGLWLVQPVEAASVPACEAINQAGAITVYRCEPDYGPPYYINSMGFMMWEE